MASGCCDFFLLVHLVVVVAWLVRLEIFGGDGGMYVAGGIVNTKHTLSMKSRTGIASLF